MLPVPLNSSYIKSSILDPVSTKAVPIIVKDPPSSQFLAAPKKCFGGYKATGSNPPDKVLPDGGTDKLYARPSLVIESSKITTSLPISTNLFALSKAISAAVV